jgi:hypothetical protein
MKKILLFFFSISNVYYLFDLLRSIVIMNIPQISSQQTLTTPLQVVSNNTTSTTSLASSQIAATTATTLINLSTNSNATTAAAAATTAVPLELLTSVNTAHILKTTPHMVKSNLK